MSSLAPDEEQDPAEPTLYLVFIHGFKGNDKTFEDFPQRLAYSLSHTFVSRFRVEPIVYPQFKTQGSLSEAVLSFLSWLQDFIAEKELAWLDAKNAQLEGKGKQRMTWSERDQARIVLMGHSMGGLVAADVVLQLLQAHNQAGPDLPLWPKIEAVIAFDTPYLGLNPGTFQNTADQYIQTATQAHDLFSSLTGISLASLWGAKAASETAAKGKGKASPVASTSKRKEEELMQASSQAAAESAAGSWLNIKTAAAVGGTAGLYSVAAGLAGMAWNQRQVISKAGFNSWDFVNSHFEFVGALFKPELLAQRLNTLVAAGEESNGARKVNFHCFYTLIPQDDKKARKRTFINLPNDKTPQRARFTANANSAVANEVDAHTAMFGNGNPGSHQLALETCRLITAWVTPQAPVKVRKG